MATAAVWTGAAPGEEALVASPAAEVASLLTLSSAEESEAEAEASVAVAMAELMEAIREDASPEMLWTALESWPASEEAAPEMELMPDPTALDRELRIELSSVAPGTAGTEGVVMVTVSAWACRIVSQFPCFEP